MCGRFAEAGADLITFHEEAASDPKSVIDEIHDNNVAAGIAINASTPVSRIEPYVGNCELALLMSIDAGFGGQAFQADSLDKFKRVREIAGDEILLEIDGGINKQTIASAVDAGAELLVVGSAIFKHDPYEPEIEALRSEMAKGRVMK
ncbi:MAG: ribulose-phosphate 3-epimerase [Pirellulaceae bacterium]